MSSRLVLLLKAALASSKVISRGSLGGCCTVLGLVPTMLVDVAAVDFSAVRPTLILVWSDSNPYFFNALHLIAVRRKAITHLLIRVGARGSVPYTCLLGMRVRCDFAVSGESLTHTAHRLRRYWFGLLRGPFTIRSFCARSSHCGAVGGCVVTPACREFGVWRMATSGVARLGDLSLHRRLQSHFQLAITFIEATYQKRLRITNWSDDYVYFSIIINDNYIQIRLNFITYQLNDLKFSDDNETDSDFGGR